MTRSIKFIPAWIASILLYGCMTVGPEYAQPEFPNTPIADVLAKTASASQKEVSITPETLATWWDTLEDPILSELIQEALAHNLDIKEAQARVLEARYQLAMSQSTLFPFVDLGAGVTKSKSSGNTTFNIGERDVYQGGFDASWEIDIFGGTRRKVEASRADLQAQQENLKAIWVSLAGEVAQRYVSLRTLQKRLAVAEKNLQNQSEIHDILVSSLQSGLTSELPVQQARYNLEQTRSTIPTLRGAIESVKNSLALLTGVMPGTLHERLQEIQPIPDSSAKVVIGIPAEALRQRPDIGMAERQLAAQTARIGQAKANLYPKFFLMGSIGLESLEADSLFNAKSKTWSIGPSISWPIFHAGSIRNNIQVETARQEQYLARYEKTILSAVKEVRDALVDYAQEQERKESLIAAVDAANSAVEVSQDQYKNGLADFHNVLDAQRSLLSLEDQLVISEGTITTNLIRIYKALGGGWTSMQETNPS